jgi:hypothetical protein
MAGAGQWCGHPIVLGPIFFYDECFLGGHRGGLSLMMTDSGGEQPLVTISRWSTQSDVIEVCPTATDRGGRGGLSVLLRDVLRFQCADH